MPFPFPCSPVVREWSGKKIQIKKSLGRLGRNPGHPLNVLCKLNLRPLSKVLSMYSHDRKKLFFERGC